MTDNRWFFDRDDLLKKGVSLATIEAIASAVERNPDEYIPQQYAGSPESNVTANFNGLCVDTTNDYLYYNFTPGATTGWTKITV